MQKINLRELYPDIYKTDTFWEVSNEVQAVFLADKRAEARQQRQMYNYKAHYSLDYDNGIEKAIIMIQTLLAWEAEILINWRRWPLQM